MPARAERFEQNQLGGIPGPAEHGRAPVRRVEPPRLASRGRHDIHVAEPDRLRLIAGRHVGDPGAVRRPVGAPLDPRPAHEQRDLPDGAIDLRKSDVVIHPFLALRPLIKGQNFGDLRRARNGGRGEVSAQPAGVDAGIGLVREHDPVPVRRPAEAGDVEVARREPHRRGRLVGRGVDRDDVQVGELVVAVDEDDVPLFLRRFLLLLRLRVPHEEGDPRPVGRPAVSAHRPFRLGELPRLAARHRQRPQLAARLALSLAARREAQPPPVGRELRGSRRRLSARPLRGPRPVRVRHPDVTQILRLRSFHKRLAHDEGDAGAVGGDRGPGDRAVLHAQRGRPPGVLRRGIRLGLDGQGKEQDGGERETVRSRRRRSKGKGWGGKARGPGHVDTSRLS